MAPAQGSAKPTVGFTEKKIISPSPTARAAGGGSVLRRDEFIFLGGHLKRHPAGFVDHQTEQDRRGDSYNRQGADYYRHPAHRVRQYRYRGIGNYGADGAYQREPADHRAAQRGGKQFGPRGVGRDGGPVVAYVDPEVAGRQPHQRPREMSRRSPIKPYMSGGDENPEG